MLGEGVPRDQGKSPLIGDRERTTVKYESGRRGRVGKWDGLRKNYFLPTLYHL